MKRTDDSDDSDESDEEKDQRLLDNTLRVWAV